ncbi:peptidoglycan-binding protein [Marinobacter nitratireducens]|nr:peptidoglycan-binding protein [Marinobacter nitratireducens]
MRRRRDAYSCAAVLALTGWLAGCSALPAENMGSRPAPDQNDSQWQVACSTELSPGQRAELDSIESLMGASRNYAALAQLETLSFDSREHWLRWAQLLAKVGQLDDSQNAYSKIAEACNIPEAYHGLGVVAQKAGNLREGLDALKQAKQLAPADADIRNDLGVALLRDQQFDEAAFELRTAYELAEGQQRIGTNMVAAYFLQGGEASVGRLQEELQLSDELVKAGVNFSQRFEANDTKVAAQQAQSADAKPASSVEVSQAADSSSKGNGSAQVQSSEVQESPVTQPGSPITVAADNSVIDIQPGQCWVNAQIQSRPVEESIQVKVRDSEVKLKVTPAEFRRGIKRVVTKEGTKTYRVIPPTYKEIEEKVLVKPESKSLVVEPAVYKTVEEQVVMEEARTELEPCSTSGATAYGAKVAAMGFCTKAIPAKTKTVKVTKLVKPETTRTEVVPAEYKTVVRRVVDKPAEVVPIETQDEIDSLEIAELVKPAKAEETRVPAVAVAMNVLRYEGKPQIVAREAVCDRDLTRDMVRELQKKLDDLGYRPGEQDGLPGPDTMAALTKYQTDKGLASGALTVETAKQLELID